MEIPAAGIVYCVVRQLTQNGTTTIVRPIKDLEYFSKTSFYNLLHSMYADVFAEEQVLALLVQFIITVTLHKCPSFLDQMMMPVADLNRRVDLHVSPSPTYRHVCFMLTGYPQHPAATTSPGALPCVNQMLMTHHIIRILPVKHNMNNKLNATHKTFNKLIDHFAEKSLGWTGGEETFERKCRERSVEKRVGYGPKFVTCLSELMSYISLHLGDTLKGVNIAVWLKYCTSIKTSKKENLSGDLLDQKIDNLQYATRGARASEQCWKDVITDVMLMCNSLEEYINGLVDQALHMHNLRYSK
jgi:hypothetical protein